MTPADLKSARKQLGLSQAELARALRMRGDHAPDTVRKWERGALDVPGYVAVVLDLALFVPGARERLVSGIPPMGSAGASSLDHS